MLKEIIVVEGYHDAEAVKRAVQGEVIVTSGYGISEKTFSLIAEAQKRCGVIILTDPDFAGEQIRRRIATRVSGCRHAYIQQADALKSNDIGVENATPEVIRAALSVAKAHESSDNFTPFTMEEMIGAELVGCPAATKRRCRLGQLLGIGDASAKTFRQRLNAFQISREEFDGALSLLEKEKE